MSVEPLLFIVIIVLALFAVFSFNLKMAIISISAFALWVSFIYLYYHAPDVSLAEAVISGSLGTILYVFTIRNYKDISTPPSKKDIRDLLRYDVILVLACIFVIFLNTQVTVIDHKELTAKVIADLQMYGSRVYPVAGILLDYRLFDTMFEALILLIAGMDVAHMIKYRKKKVVIY